MNITRLKIVLASILAWGLCTIPTMASACPVCYGNAESPRVQGMNTAIMAMLGITGFVLTGIGTFFIMVVKRIRANRHAARTSFVDDNGDLQWNNF
jgi:hypothetical protein